MDTDAKAVVVGDVCAQIAKSGISLCAVVHVYEDVWMASSKENPWPPQSGQIVADMTERMKMWQGYYDRLLNPKPQLAAPVPKPPEPPKYGAEHWNEMDQENRARLMIDLREYAPFLRNMLLRSYKVPDGFYQEYWEKADENKTS